jgi:hypothetical protein
MLHYYSVHVCVHKIQFAYVYVWYNTLQYPGPIAYMCRVYSMCTPGGATASYISYSFNPRGVVLITNKYNCLWH